jgi:hypothetical protein
LEAAYNRIVVGSDDKDPGSLDSEKPSESEGSQIGQKQRYANVEY